MPEPFWSEDDKRRWLEGDPEPPRSLWGQTLDVLENSLGRDHEGTERPPLAHPRTDQILLNDLFSLIGSHYPGMKRDIPLEMASPLGLVGGLTMGADAAASKLPRVLAQSAAKVATAAAEAAPIMEAAPKAVDVGDALLARIVRKGVALDQARYPDAAALAETDLAAARNAYKQFLETGKAPPNFTLDMPELPLRKQAITPMVPRGLRPPPEYRELLPPPQPIPPEPLVSGVPALPPAAPIEVRMAAARRLAEAPRFGRTVPEGSNARLAELLAGEPDVPKSTTDLGIRMAAERRLAASPRSFQTAPEGFDATLGEYLSNKGGTLIPKLMTPSELRMDASRRLLEAPRFSRVVTGDLDTKMGELLSGERGEAYFPLAEIGRGARAVANELLPGLRPKALVTSTPVLDDLGNIVQMPRDPAVAKIAEGLAVAKRVRINRGELDVARAEDISRKVAIASAREAQTSGLERIPGITSGLSGAAPAAKQFAPPSALELTGDEVTHVIDDIIGKNPTLQLFDRLSAYRGLNKLALNDVPTDAEIDILGKALGIDIAESLRRLRGFDAKVREGVLDGLGILKAIKSAYDFSAPLRQGLFLTARHPFVSAEEFVKMFRHFASENGSIELQSIIANDPLTAEIERVRPHTFTNPVGHVHAEREEPFAIVTDLAHNWLPGLRMTERAYTGYLNSLRFGVIKAAVKNAEAAGEPIGALSVQNMTRDLGGAVAPEKLDVVTGIGRRKELGELVDAVMTLSGRGPKLPHIPAEWLNVGFWSPRLVSSRFDTVVRLGKAAGEYATAGASQLQGNEAHISAATKEVAQDVAATVGLGVSILALMKGTGVAEVELDPRSPDFGRGRVGKTRFDFWGGFQQIARYTAQVATGQAKSLGTDLMRDTGSLEPMGRFLRSKLSPVAGLPVDALSGQTFTGDPASPERLAWNAFVPLFISDVRDAVIEDGAKAGFRTIPGAFGVGVQTFNTKEDMTQLFAPGVRYRDIADSKLRQQIDMAWKIYRLSDREVQAIRDAQEGRGLLRRMNRGQSPATMEANQERVREYLRDRRTLGNE